MNATIKILHLEDAPSDAELVQRALKKANLHFDLRWVTNKKDFQQALKEFNPDIILSDHSLPSFNSIEAFGIVKEAGITSPFILVTATISEEFAVGRIKDGVTDYLLKDRLERLPSAIINALEKHLAEADRLHFLNQVIENENLLRNTEKLARIGSWKRDFKTGKVQWSDELFEMFGYKKDEVVPSFEIAAKHVHPDDLVMFKQVSHDTMKNGGNAKMTFRQIDAKGNAKWIYCELIVEKDAMGNSISIKGFNQDVTERKMAEQEIIALNESLEKKVKERTEQLHTANKELEAFSYTVAHDLRAPLRVTNGFVSILLQEHNESLNAEGQYLLNVIATSSQQMSQLVADLLELSRLGKASVSAVSCSMYDIVVEACEFVKSSDDKARANFRLLDLPEIKCDPGLMKQVWLNLVSNAVKYSGKVEHPLIEIGSITKKDAVTYFIKDNGAGFDMQLSEKLFRPFQRLHKKSDYEGTGVGLALTQMIVNKHGGKMWAEGEVGKGATFFFSLPDLKN